MTQSPEQIWQHIISHAKAQSDPVLQPYFESKVIKQASMATALAKHLADKYLRIENQILNLEEVMASIMAKPSVLQAISNDLQAIYQRDSACTNYLMPFLYFKGFAALQTYRVAHHLWHRQQKQLALLLQNLASEAYAVDIHPATTIGSGIMMDHATGIVIGETAVIGDNVSIMQGVTLGGTGKEEGQRHPKVASGVLISAGAKILGDITIGANAKIGAGSVVLQSVAANTTVAGVPAIVVGKTKERAPALEMDHQL